MAAPAVPQFCPWCGTPIGFDEHAHEPRYATLQAEAETRGQSMPELPERVRELLAGESYAGACPGCRMISHVVGHRATA